MLDVQLHNMRPTGRAAQLASPPASAGLDPPQATTVLVERENDPLSRLMQTVIEQRTLEHSSAASDAVRVQRKLAGGGLRAHDSSVAPGAVQQAMIQRTPESAKLLKELASPQILKPPALGAQKEIIRKLEAAIVEWAKGFKEQRRFGSFYPDDDQLFLGAIELARVPESADKDHELIRDSTLIDVGTANSLKRSDYALVQTAGVERDVVTNTLQTMIAARQIEYLRKSGLPNDEWKILIEVHYTRRRGKNSPQFHKDTLGQTLFVNLNYATEDPVAGPEYMVNPTPLEEWDAVISGSLPPEFYKDLLKAREELNDLQQIEVSDVPAHGAVAFVDEAIHHRTPILGHRTVRGGAFETFLKGRYGAKRYDEASMAYDKYMASRWPTATYPAHSQKWFKWIAMARQSDARFTRPNFAATGMSTAEVDELLAVADRESSTVSIPKLKQGAPQEIFPANREGRRPLKRQMSERALNNNLPPDPPGVRRFFRTWVIAVRR